MVPEMSLDEKVREIKASELIFPDWKSEEGKIKQGTDGKTPFEEGSNQTSTLMDWINQRVSKIKAGII